MEKGSGRQVYAFIDNQNLNMTIQNMGWKIDWQKFRRLLADKYGVTKAFMFIGYVPEQEEMYTQLHNAGYAIVLKPTFDMTRPRPKQDLPAAQADEGQGKAYKTFGEQAAETLIGEKSNNAAAPRREESEGAKRPIKGNVDAELVLWAVKEMPNYDGAVIITGDGDFYSLVEYLQEQGKLHKLLTPSGRYSNLFNRFDKYIDRIDQQRRHLTYRPRRFSKGEKQPPPK
jgi:uncharacterized LabA/DUF88 family protein